MVTQTDLAIAFEDINPQAPTHVLVVPRAHHATITDLASDPEALHATLDLAARLGGQAGPGGFRLVLNTGPDAGQTVHHVHVHVLAGRNLHWPPG